MGSVMHLAKCLQVKRHGRRRGRLGQVAVIFIVLMALMLVLASFTMNLGQVAQLKTATANAADAGALASASWVASGTNEVADITKLMELNRMLVRLLFIRPSCPEACIPEAVKLMLALSLINAWHLKEASKITMHAAWDNAKAAALFTAIQNAGIDDQSGDVGREIDLLIDDFEETREVPSDVTFSWTRKGAGGVDRPSWVEVSVLFPPDSRRPNLKMNAWLPEVLFCWTPCIFICCWGPPFGFRPVAGGSKAAAAAAAPHHPAVVAVAGRTKAWKVMALASFLLSSVPGRCALNTCFLFPYPLFLITFIFGGILPRVRPDEIQHATGEVTVTVRLHREGDPASGGPLHFWRMQYPDEVVSRAVARYGGADVRSPNATARLVAIDGRGRSDDGGNGNGGNGNGGNGDGDGGNGEN